MENTEINISSDDKTLIKSGVLLLNSANFEIQINELIIEFSFITDENRNKPGINAVAKEDLKKLDAKLMNYIKNNAGFLEPLNIGSMAKQDLYISYWVQIINPEKERRIFTFNLWLGKENDW